METCISKNENIHIFNKCFIVVCVIAFKGVFYRHTKVKPKFPLFKRQTMQPLTSLNQKYISRFFGFVFAPISLVTDAAAELVL